jgi:hypothetical protein
MDHSSSELSLSTPVVFLIFNRPDLTSMVFAEIARAKPKTLLIVADGPRNSEESQKCLEARRVTERVNWNCELLTNFADRNMGCKSRIASGLDWAFSIIEEAIVLEDDCLPTLSFFPFCEKLLNHYREDKRVMHISGNNFQFNRPKPSSSYYFSRYTHVWGWASWRRAWKYYDCEMASWPEFKKSGTLNYICDDLFELSHWASVFEQVYSGAIDTWDYQWLYACWTQNALSILPSSNLVSNIGFRSDATHTQGTSHTANLATKDIWQLQHPYFMVADRIADRFTFNEILGGNRLREAATFRGRMRRRLSRVSKRLMKKRKNPP